MAALSTIAAVGAGLWAAKHGTPKAAPTPTVAPLPGPSPAEQTRAAEEAAQTAAAIAHRRSQAMQSGTLLTGFTGPYQQPPAPVQRKLLLGM